MQYTSNHSLHNFYTMNYIITKKEKGVVELVVTLPLADIKPRLKQAAKEISKNLKVDGFRAGHMPYDIVKREVGELKIYEYAADALIQKSYFEAVKKELVQPITSPRVSFEKIAPENDVVYKAVVSVMPKISIGELSKIKIKQEPIVVDEKEVEKAINQIRRMRAKEVLQEKKAEQGDKVEIDFDVFVDNVPIEGGASKNYPLVLGDKQFIPGFEEALVGVQAKEKKEFTLPFPKDYHAKHLAGKKADFKVLIHAVFKRELPELNDGFAKQLGFESVEKCKEQLGHNLYHEEEYKRDQKDEQKILEEIISSSTIGDIPDVLVNSEINKMLSELQQHISQQGLKFEEYLSQINTSVEKLKMEFAKTALVRVKAALVTRQIFFDQKFTIEEKEVLEETEKLKKMYHESQDALKQIESDDFKEYIESTIGNRKVMEFLKNTCLKKAKDAHEH